MKRLGILGFAHGHLYAYVDRWKNNPEWGIEVAAGWDHDAGRAEENCTRLELSRTESARQMVDRPDIDAVLICAETAYHAELVELAAAAGKTIIVQKPLCLTLEEADRICEAVAKHGARFTLAWQMRVDPQNLRMKQLVESGELGQLFMVRRRHTLSTHTWPGFAKLWHNDPKLNRDIWADDAAHPIDFIHWLLGFPDTVTAEMDTLFDPAVPNDNGIAIFRYSGGPIAEVVCSFTSVSGENTTEILGEKGMVIQNYGDGPSCSMPRPEGAIGLKWYLHGGSEWIDSGIPSPAGHGERIAGLAQPLADFVHGRREPIATAEEGRLSLRMVLACYRSSQQGQRVTP